MIGCSSKIISNGLEWQPKPERPGRTLKTTISMDRKTGKMATSQPMISSRVIKEELTLPLRYWQEAPAMSHCWKKLHVLKRLQFPKSTLTGLKGNGAFFVDWWQTLNSSHSTQCRQWIMVEQASWYGDVSHTMMSGLFISYQGSWISLNTGTQNTWKGHVALCWRENGLEMDVSTRQWPQTDQ